MAVKSEFSGDLVPLELEYQNNVVICNNVMLIVSLVHSKHFIFPTQLGFSLIYKNARKSFTYYDGLKMQNYSYTEYDQNDNGMRKGMC